MAKHPFLRPDAVDFLEGFTPGQKDGVSVVLSNGTRFEIHAEAAADLHAAIELAESVRLHDLNLTRERMLARADLANALSAELPATLTVFRSLPPETTFATMIAAGVDTLARVLGRLGVDVGGDPLGSMFEDFLRGPAEPERTPEPEPPAAAELTPQPPAAPPPIKRQRRAAQETSAAAEAPRADEG